MMRSGVAFFFLWGGKEVHIYLEVDQFLLKKWSKHKFDTSGDYMTHMHDKQIKQTSIIFWKVGCKLEEAFLIRKTHEPKVELCLSAECSEHQVNKKGAAWCPSLTRHEHKIRGGDG